MNTDEGKVEGYKGQIKGGRGEGRGKVEGIGGEGGTGEGKEGGVSRMEEVAG